MLEKRHVAGDNRRGQSSWTGLLGGCLQSGRVVGGKTAHLRAVVPDGQGRGGDVVEREPKGEVQRAVTAPQVSPCLRAELLQRRRRAGAAGGGPRGLESSEQHAVIRGAGPGMADGTYLGKGRRGSSRWAMGSRRLEVTGNRDPGGETVELQFRNLPYRLDIFSCLLFVRSKEPLT